MVKQLLLEQNVNKIVMALLFACMYLSISYAPDYTKWIAASGCFMFIADLFMAKRQHRFISEIAGYVQSTRMQILMMVDVVQDTIGIVEKSGNDKLLEEIHENIIPILEKVADHAKKLGESKR